MSDTIKEGNQVTFTAGNPEGGIKRVYGVVRQDLGEGYFAIQGINPGTRRQNAGSYRIHESNIRKVGE